VSERKYRQFTPEQKTEIVLAGLRGDRSVRDVCRAYEISDALYYDWRARLPLVREGSVLTTPASWRSRGPTPPTGPGWSQLLPRESWVTR
jgi:transposase-like protein